MESREEEFETAVLVKNIPSKKYILDLGYRFLASKGMGKSYRLRNSKTEINFIVHNSEIAYELMKYFEDEKQINNQLKEIEVQLTMIPKGSNETLNDEINDNYKTHKNEHKISASIKAANQKDEDYRNVPYFQRHTQDISNKAGIVSTDSPYITSEEVRRIEEKESRKKDISNKKFTTSLPKYPHNDNAGLDTLPYGNIEAFQFRDENKKKWMSKRGFQVYG